MTDGFGTPDLTPPPKDGFSTPGTADPTYVPRGDAEARAKIPRDQWDRYLMSHLDGTKVAKNKGFTRVSTTKKALSNQDGIRRWGNWKIVEGLGADPNLITEAIRAASLLDGPEKNKALGRVAKSAFIRGGGKDRSGLGTAFHELTETINRLQVPENGITDEIAPNLDAYYQVLAENDAQILPEYMERVVLCPYNHGGALDNIMRIWNPDTEDWELCIVDLKTGRSLDRAWLEILMQLWLYANAYAMWTTTKVIYSQDDPTVVVDVEGFYEPMPPELRKDKAFIVHVPLDGTAELIEVDLSGVEQYVYAAVVARRGNAEAKHKVRSRGKVQPAAFVSQNTAATSSADLAARETTTVAVQVPQDSLMQSLENAERRTLPQRPVTPESVTEEKNAYGLDPHVYPTKDARKGRAGTVATFIQELKAAERLAKVDEMAAKVRNDDTDDDPAPANRGITLPDPERDPVTGRKKRTCGYCRKPGHVQKTCPENPASTKYVKPDPSTPTDAQPLADAGREPVPAGEPEPGNTCNCLGDDDWHPWNAATCKLQVATVVSQGTEPAPYCTLAHTCQWTSQHPDAPGQWVCTVSGKPSRGAYEAGLTAVTTEGPRYGAPLPADPDVIAADPEYAVGDTVTVGGIPFTKHTEPPAAWAAFTPNVPTVLDQIAAAGSSADVLKVRDEALREGVWVESMHDGPAQARYRELLH